MPKKCEERKTVVDLRHNEYYGMQQTLDDLYAQSKNGEIFTNITDIIFSRENILLAYRNIKKNNGSLTPGSDKQNIADIAKLDPDDFVEKVRYIVRGSKHGYRPKPVRRKEIPKQNGELRPLGIPCIWDRIIQQCIKQVMEPICEAKFSNNSYGFRPGRCVEHAMKIAYKHMQVDGLHYVVEFDIKGFFDNVNHSKLIKQIWSLGIRDKELLYLIKKILKAPIKLNDGIMVNPDKGTPQGGIISPLLANIVLNELDQWIDSQWINHPVTEKYSIRYYDGKRSPNKGHGYRAMKETKLKEMYIVRYADDFRIFCRNKDDADKVLIAVTNWLKERLKLDVSKEKTRVINTERENSKFLGFEMRLRNKRNKKLLVSRIESKALKRIETKLVKQAKNIPLPRIGKTIKEEIHLYNAMVMGIQNYYCIATMVNIDLHIANRKVMRVLTNRMQKGRSNYLIKKGRPLTVAERSIYNRSAMMRYDSRTDEPIYPIGYVKHKHPVGKKFAQCNYTLEGRIGVHDSLSVNKTLLINLMKYKDYGNVEFSDNKLSLFSAQYGKCAVTGRPFSCTEEIHCHHRIPKSQGGTDSYMNLTLILKDVHKLVHATETETIKNYLEKLNLDKKQYEKVNELRKMAKLKEF